MPWSRSDTTDFDSDIGNDIDWEQWYGGTDVESTDVGTEAQYSATTVFASDDEEGDNSASWQDEYSDRDDASLAQDSQSFRPQHRPCEVGTQTEPLQSGDIEFFRIRYAWLPEQDQAGQRTSVQHCSGFLLPSSGSHHMALNASASDHQSNDDHGVIEV